MRRWDVIADLANRNGLTIGAEIGVAEGRFSAALLTLCSELRLWAIDDYRPGYMTWMGTQWSADEQQGNYRRFRSVAERFPDRLAFIDRPSVEAAASFADATFDVVFIDADHEYGAVRADIEAWLPKVRPGGWITGHDYNHQLFPGVVAAVEERFKDFNLGVDTVWMAQVP